MSSKAQQYRVTRGAQGDASKQFGVSGRLMNGGNDWPFPVTYEHNQTIDEVYVDVDRKHNRIDSSVKNRDKQLASAPTNDAIKTKVTLTLPKISETDFNDLINFWHQYTLFNTHLSYHLYYNHNESPIRLSC